MIEERWRRLRELFEQLHELPMAERNAILDRELAGQPQLRAELELLLTDSDSANEFLTDPPTPASGSLIGPYRLLEPLGEGGFGVVYLAEQERPISRRVALKLIKPGMDTKQVIARFRTEQQALALMDHPGIAHVFEAGETELGRPYFAMEYVPGVPITTFCDQERLRLRDRLQLFLQVCDAVQHAHQKGVIHRDLKPSNILVLRRDGLPVLKIIDFGIVKATGDALSHERTMTREGVVVGTVSYMSPEQFGASDAPVDTRSDIYSLGVVLYELLSGDLPFDRTLLRKATWAEAMRIIREEDPLPPAAHLARLETSQIAECRSTDSRTLLRSLKGELEWITFRALEKEPDRRYASASELAADIRRHLANEPVLASAPGALYRLRKYARRHRGAVTAAAVVLLAIIAGGIAAGIGFNRAVRAERVAKREAEASRQVADFLVDLFHASGPDKSNGETLTARMLLDEGSRRIEGLKADPYVRARLLGAMGDSYLNLQITNEGLRLTRAALDAVESAEPTDHVEIAQQMDRLMNAFSMAGQADSIPGLVDRAIAHLEASKAGDRDLYAACLYRRARAVMEQGDLVAADSIITVALRISEEQPVLSASRRNRLYSTKATIAHRQYRLEDAERYSLRTLELAEEAGELGRTVTNRSRLAGLYVDMGQGEKALQQAEKAVEIARRIFGPDHDSLADALSGLTNALSNLGRYTEAIRAQEEAVRILRKIGRSSEHMGYELHILGSAYLSAGRHDLAIASLAESYDVYLRSQGFVDLQAGGTVADLGRSYAAAGLAQRADSAFQAAMAVFDRLHDTSVYTPLTLRDYASFCRDQGHLERADSLYARAESVLDSTNAGLRPIRGEVLIGRARVRALQGRHAEAESMIAAGFRLKRGGSTEDDRGLVEAYLSWAGVRARAGNLEGAIERLRAAVRCGAKPASLKPYPELAALRSRPDYPLDTLP